METLHLHLITATWPRVLESTFCVKIASRSCWETAQLSKMLCDDARLTVKEYGHNIILCHQSFLCCIVFPQPAGSSSLLGDYSRSMILKPYRAFEYFRQFKCCFKRDLMVHCQLTECDRGNLIYVKWVTCHSIFVFTFL